MSNPSEPVRLEVESVLDAIEEDEVTGDAAVPEEPEATPSDAPSHPVRLPEIP